MSYLECRIRDCMLDIQENNSEIQRYEELHESLESFKGDVFSSQNSFSSVNSAKKNRANTLDNCSYDCKTAKEYINGMNKVLVGVGISYAGCTFSSLLTTIDTKLKEYQGKIQTLKTRNASLRAEIDDLNDQIRQEAEAYE